MSSKEKEYNVITGIFDVITKGIRKSVLERAEDGKPLGVGVYTDEYCELTDFSRPMKSVEHRREIAQGLTGVAFTFPASSREFGDYEAAADAAYKEYIERVKQEQAPKQYKAGFVIGSFDLLHSGHLQNIELASEMCEDLYVVVKTDERIREKKHKDPVQNTAQRAANLRALKKVKDVLYYDLDSDRTDVVLSVIEQYERDHQGESLEPKDLVAIFGEDLKAKEEERKRNGDWGEVCVAFTPRSEEKMQLISSSTYKRMIEETGGISSYEDKEDKGLNDVNGGSTQSEGHGEIEI